MFKNILSKFMQKTVKKETKRLNSNITSVPSTLKPKNKSPKVNKKKRAKVDLYTKVEVEYLLSLKGKYTYWREVAQDFNKKFKNHKRSVDSLKSKVENVLGTCSNFVTLHCYTPEMHLFLQTHSKNMTIMEIRNALHKHFNLDKPRDVIHEMIKLYNYPYKQEKKRRKDFDKVVLKFYDEVSQIKEIPSKSYVSYITKMASNYYGEDICKASIGNVLYRNHIKNCKSVEKLLTKRI